MQKLFTLVVAGLIIYVLMHTQFSEFRKTTFQETPSPITAVAPNNTTEVAMEGNFLEKSLSKMLVNVLKTNEGRTFFENLIQPVNKPLSSKGSGGFRLDNSGMIQSMFKINTSGVRKLGPASCGHVVKASYQVTTLNNEIVEDTVKTFNLGGNEVMIGLSDIIVGMYEGEMREGVVMPQYAAGAKNPKIAYKIKVLLESIIPKVFVDDSVKIFDDEIAYKTPYLCGERAIFDVKVSKCSGEVVYNSQDSRQPVNMVLGDMAYPMIFSHALFGKVPTGTRTVIAQGKYLKTMGIQSINKIFSKNNQPPAEEFFILEFKNFAEDGR